MANVKITDLAALTNPASTDVLPIVDVGADVTKKISIADLLENAGSGTASAPGIAFDGDSNTGIYRPGADQLAISTNGTGRLFVDANGRVGVGVSSFITTGEKLKVLNGSSGATSINGLNNLVVENSTDGGIAILNPNSNIGSIAFGDNDNGAIGRIRYLHSSDAMMFQTNGSERLRITSDGKLGLGTSSPGALLHVKGETDASLLVNTVSGEAGVIFAVGSGGLQKGGVFFEADATFSRGSLSLCTNNEADSSSVTVDDARLTVTKSGNVGIGTTSPGADLEIYSTAFTDIILNSGRTSGNLGGVSFSSAGTQKGQIYGTFGGENIYLSDTAHVFCGSSTSTEKARIDSSGRFLVGTSTAYSQGNFVPNLQQHATSALGTGIYRWSGNSGGPLIGLAKSRGATIGTNAIVQNNDSLGTIIFSGDDGTNLNNQGASISAEVDGTPGADDMPGRLVFSSNPGAPATGPSEAMRINSAQELLIGYTSDNGAYKLQVNSQIFATSATIATSDGRYKENVASLNGCLDLVKALHPVSFTWKPQEDITRLDDEGNEVLVREGHNFPEGSQVGFIAQEVQQVLDGKPWFGSVIKENVRPAVKDNDGNELAPEEQFYGIAEGNLIAVLTNALQEATAKIEDLEARLTAAGL